ncbi:MAG: glycosyltransferase family 2 protein [Roseburia sp.]|nr:glycosyltransferase family 2 protein [Roseburia sp.]MCM1201634.1 glycosyltransferase family 2 protein [Bacteroides fragilis]
MNTIGVFICNYNKADYVVKCVEKVIDQTFKDLDIYVIDNASADGSVAKLRESFGDTVHIIVNAENIGGSGGFNTGIKKAAELGYRYIMLLDNDAMLEEHAIEYLYEYLKTHEDVGFCGAETLNMDYPEIYQDFGGRLDFDSFYMKGIMARSRKLELSVAMEADYVASCALLCRMEAVKAAGGMPEENFIYWDDVEMCMRCRRAGYKVVVLGLAKAYHDISGAGPQNLFLAYYANRNRYRFYTKYLPEERLDEFYDNVTYELFSKLYGCPPKKLMATMMTRWNAWDDFAHGITGKAEDGKIGIFTRENSLLRQKLAGWEKVFILMPRHNGADYQALNTVLNYFSGINERMEVTVAFSTEGYDLDRFDALFRLCEHVTKVGENILPWYYIDGYKNWIGDEKDYFYFTSFDKALRQFKEMYRPYFEKRKKELRDDAES